MKSRKKINMKSLVAELTPGVDELKKIGGKGGFWETVRMNSGWLWLGVARGGCGFKAPPLAVRPKPAGWGCSFLMVYRNKKQQETTNAGRLGASFIGVCLETRWLGHFGGFYVPGPYCRVLSRWLDPNRHTTSEHGFTHTHVFSHTWLWLIHVHMCKIWLVQSCFTHVCIVPGPHAVSHVISHTWHIHVYKIWQIQSSHTCIM